MHVQHVCTYVSYLYPFDTSFRYRLEACRIVLYCFAKFLHTHSYFSPYRTSMTEQMEALLEGTPVVLRGALKSWPAVRAHPY